MIDKTSERTSGNASDTEVQFLDSNLSISNTIPSTQIYNMREDFDFAIVNFLFFFFFFFFFFWMATSAVLQSLCKCIVLN